MEEPDKVPDGNILNGSTKNDQNNKSEKIKIEKNERQANEEANSNCLELEKDETEKVNQNIEIEENSRITEIQEKQSKKERHCICDNNEQFKDWDQVQCDNCETWFHQFCMKLTMTQATFLTRYEDSMKWFCTQCQTKNHV